jgi:hypothetical protein
MAFCALEYLDEHLAAKLQPKWRSFSQNKQYINLANTREDFFKMYDKSRENSYLKIGSQT